MAASPARAALTLLALALALVSAPRADARPRVLPKLGPCSPTVTQTLYFSDLRGLTARTQFPATSTVLMYMSGNITLDAPVILNSAFSCTMIQADPELNGAMPFFYYPGNDKAVMVVVNATNLMFQGVGFKHEWTYEWMPAMRANRTGWLYPSWWLQSQDGFFDLWWTWAGLTIYRSYNVLVTQCTVLGRLDIIRSGLVDVSYSHIYVDNDFWQGINGTRQALGFGYTWGVVRIMLCGDQVGLVRANNRIAHNYIRGTTTSVFLYWGAVGNIVQNNYITGYGFGGLQCGQGMRNVADCMLNTFELNYITPDPDIPTDADGSGIYYDLHWFNPGNRDSCNYQVNTTRCYYIDYCTSGVLVEGAVCIYGEGIHGPNINAGGQGIKLNTGKMNVFKSVVLVSNSRNMRMGWLSCMNWCINRCGPGTNQTEGRAWWEGFQARFNNPLWNTNYPLLKGICTDMGYTFKGQYLKCNPGISTVPNPGMPLPFCYLNMTKSNTRTGTYFSPGPVVTGNCSGLPMLNDFQSVILVSNFSVTNTRSYFYNLQQLYIDKDCAPFGGFIPGANNVPTNSPKWPPHSLGFNDEAGFDYGADDPSAPVYQRYPDFYSCPRRLVGPQTSMFARSRQHNSLFKKFNRHRPAWMAKKVDKAYFQKFTMRDYAKKFRKAARYMKS